MVSVIQRAKDSGRCPPSLLTEGAMDPDGFEVGVAKLLDSAGFGLVADTSIVSSFQVVLKVS
eukprot:CAMPEP_0168726750 /NCGR_PEP_ID=MMETSP0724-20121128/4827_1 /TAXON_ID=265536 /ORGANISM="Amphiprora sp., Strain CCMP467" /LENGTH=61 /DNA_ID=CAMNT_0008773569 /DNA_START=65 /DNA_END=250 /DNA_ORIENTATION=-